MGTANWNKVEDFIRAYELGSRWECDFMNLLTNQLNDKYGIPMPTRGLIEQLKLVSAKNKVNWEDLFIQEAKEVLQNESDKDKEYRFRKILRNKILKYFEVIPEKMSGAYFMNLNQINLQIDDWHGVNLTREEIELFKEIRESINNEIAIHLLDEFELDDSIKSKIIRKRREATRIIRSIFSKATSQHEI